MDSPAILLTVPSNVRINYNLIPAPLSDKVAQAIEEKDAVAAVCREINNFYYNQE